MFTPGKWNIADYMSRRHGNRAGTSRDKEADLFVKSVVEVECCHAICDTSAVTIDMVREATEQCELMAILKRAIKDGRFEADDRLKPFRATEIKNSLSVSDGLVCRGKRVVIPPNLQKLVVQISHDGHQGVSKAKSFLRIFCWFPGIDQLVEKQVKRCLPCQSVRPANHHEPVQPSQLPDGPWQYVEMDFQGPYPNNEYLLVMIDRYSRWPEVSVFKNPPNARTTIKAMKAIFANKGTPETCHSDNGSPFQSDALKKFAKEEGFRHKHITPEWPRANGTVERFNRSMKEAVQAETINGVPFRDAVMKFTRAYRATPHCATGVSPHAAMHGGREMRTRLPLMRLKDSIIDRDRDEKYRNNMRDDYTSHSLQCGDRVVVTQRKSNKLTPAFNPKPLTVTDVAGSMITASDGGYTVTRNASQFRKVENDSDPTEEIESSDDESIAQDGDNAEDVTVTDQPIRRSPRESREPDWYGPVVKH